MGTLVIAVGLCWALAFIVVGLAYGLQMYADGSMFSYAVAVQDAWAFHWHNISGRLFVYLFSLAPAELYVALTGSARGGIVVYGLLQFGAPLLGLAATYAADRSRGHIIFTYACASTALLCPLVFGFPTELWMAHAVFWPTLAVCPHARPGIAGNAVVIAALVALVLTHEGALVFALAIMATLLLRVPRDAIVLRTGGALLIAIAIWAAVKATLRPDDYFGSVVTTAALKLIDPDNLTSRAFLVVLAALAVYGIALALLRRIPSARAHLAVVIAAAALAAYWFWLDRALHTDDRYALRTVLLIATPALGALAGAFALRADGRLDRSIPFVAGALAALSGAGTVRAATGAVAVITLVHAVETAKFVTAWSDYKAAVRALATGTASDPALGDPRFVSSARIGGSLNRLSWFSTTPYLSVLLAPGMAPSRLVIDPQGNYFWLSCRTAADNQAAHRSVPERSRELVRLYSCLHR